MIKDQSGLEEETKDPDRYNAINFKQPKKLPRTLDELDKDPDFQLLLDVPTFKVLTSWPTTMAEFTRICSCPLVATGNDSSCANLFE